MITQKAFPIIAIICLLFAACESSSMTSEGETIVVTPAIKGNSASVKVGDILEVQIPTIPKEGSEWQVEKIDAKILTQEGDIEYIQDENADSAGGITTLRFKAVGTGTTTLTLVYGTATESSNSFAVTVEVE
jgi:Predicted secreted protein